MNKPDYLPFDHCLRWQVQSRTNSHECYIVDLGMPHCQCKFWQCEVGPKIKKGLPLRKYCTHYEIAKRRFADWAIWAFYNDDPNRQHDQEQLQ